jgi:thiol:disulfide interchange protein
MRARISTFFTFLIALIAFGVPFSGFAQFGIQGSNGPMQMADPVKWSFESKNINDNERELIFTATIDKGWHIYSIIPSKDDLGLPTAFNFDKSSGFKIIGAASEPAAKKKVEEGVGEYYYHKGKVSFKQKIKALTNENFTIKGVVEFMACLDESCLPPAEAEFSIMVEGATGAMADATKEDSAEETNEDAIATPAINNEIPDMPEAEAYEPVKAPALQSFWGIFIAGFIGGLLALLTPCVFPMIPLTVSFFTKKSKTRAKGIVNALIYGISIIFIYVSLGFSITKALGPDALNALASNVWMNLAFFVIFIVFAISFLGAFEITLPSSWITKADSASDRGGLLGIFFMAFTLSLVSFSCTGPIIGTLLVEAAVGGNAMGPLMGMAGFSMALALPFGLFAAFPGWLNSLPKSGGWLNSVKVVLGLLELALALKFLSNVDLAYHWGILTREVFIALWIIIFTILGFYLLGKIKFSHDSDVKHVTIPRLFLSIITFAFVVYLIPGMWGAPLKLISGFPPPTFYTEGWSMGQSSSVLQVGNNGQQAIKGVDRSHCPHNLSCFHDYDLALNYARSQNKPLLVDFTGWSCVNCRKMEDKVWIDPRVLNRLENDYVLVSLYVDDKTTLPENEQYVSPVTGKKVKTIGNKWSDFQISRFQSSTQPLYVLLDENEQMLIEATSYDANIEKYIKFLDKGKTEFAKRKPYSPILQVDLK